MKSTKVKRKADAAIDRENAAGRKELPDFYMQRIQIPTGEGAAIGMVLQLRSAL